MGGGGGGGSENILRSGMEFSQIDEKLSRPVLFTKYEHLLYASNSSKVTVVTLISKNYSV